MGIKEDLKKAINSAAPRKIEMNRSMTIEELFALLDHIENIGDRACVGPHGALLHPIAHGIECHRIFRSGC